ncbi:MAG TPA: ATPase, T2SS/T4P/T4SS family, partial [Galbitalea sp.]
MSKPVYEIPVNGDESGEPVRFPPPARDSRPRNLTTAPPPSASGPAPTYPTTPEAPFTSPPPTIAPEGGWPANNSSDAALPPTPGLTPAPTPAPVFNGPPPEGAWAAAPALEPSGTANFPPPAAPKAQAAPAPVAAEQLAPPAPAGDLSFPPPSAESLSYAEQMFAQDGVSSTLASADPDLIAALSEVLFLNASDLHVAVNTPPMFRVDGALAPRSVTTPWSREKVTTALRSILTEAQQARFDEELELDIAYTISANARFRVNMYQQRGALGAAFRLIPTEIKSLEDLGIPGTISQFATLPRGLVLVTGPTGSGKSTTLAALIDLVNKTRADHIMTVED